MVRAVHVVLHFLVLIYIPFNVNAETLRGNPLELLFRLLGKRSRSPIIAIFNTGSNLKPLLRTSDVKNQGLDEKTALRFINDIIQSTGDENNPKVKKTNEKFGKALRTRCEKYIECEIKCKKIEKDKCQKSCQDVYDDLMVCKPTKDKWLQKTNRQVYNYLKKNPPQYNKRNKDKCNTSTKGPKFADSDECNSRSDECRPNNECDSQSSDECKANDSCN